MPRPINNPESLAVLQKIASQVDSISNPSFLKGVAQRLGLMAPDSTRVSHKDIYAMNAMIYGGNDTDSVTVVPYDGYSEGENAGRYSYTDGRMSVRTGHDEVLPDIMIHELKHKEDYEAAKAGGLTEEFKYRQELGVPYYERGTEIEARALALVGEFANETGKVRPWQEVEDEILTKDPADKDFYFLKYGKDTAINNMAKNLRYIDEGFLHNRINQTKRDSLVGLAKKTYEDAAAYSGY